MPLLTSIINWLNINRLHQINQIRVQPFEIQNDVFYKLINKALKTEWGFQHNFASIKKL